MGPFAWRPPFPKALRGKETMTKRLSSSGTFIFLAGLVALTSVRMTVAAAAVHPDGYVEIRDRLKMLLLAVAKIFRRWKSKAPCCDIQLFKRWQSSECRTSAGGRRPTHLSS